MIKDTYLLFYEKLDVYNPEYAVKKNCETGNERREKPEMREKFHEFFSSRKKNTLSTSSFFVSNLNHKDVDQVIT